MSSSEFVQSQSAPQVFSVSALNADVRQLLEIHYGNIVVEGEISNFARPASGHWYFTLKDDKAQIRCAMFRGRNIGVRFRPDNGQLVRVTARISLYEGRGDYQLLVGQMEPAGNGGLQQAFEALKRKLQGEGLFNSERKKSLPAHIRHVGVITSATGAAIRDVLSVLARRFPGLRVTILPVPVQGQEAAPAMVRALGIANARSGPLHDLDAVLLTRGGGSLEDLWAFNDEQLARAIAASDLPVVSAVGHEVDFTIADFVADLRAATPSAAAELLSPSREEYLSLFRGYAEQFRSLTLRHLRHEAQLLKGLTLRLRDPRRRLQEQAQRLDELEARLRRGLANSSFRSHSSLRELRARLQHQSPANILPQLLRELRHLQGRLVAAMHGTLKQRRQEIASHGHSLQLVSPLATLARGYSISFKADGKVIRSSDELNIGDRVTTRLGKGTFDSIVAGGKPGEQD